MTVDELPLHLDLSVLSDASLTAACLYAANVSGRRVFYSSHDLYRLVWMPAGIIPNWTCADEEGSADAFHMDRLDEIESLVPPGSRLEEPAASVGLALRAIREGWLVHQPYYDLRNEVEDFFSLPDSALYGLHGWDGTLREFLRQPWVTTSPDLSDLSDIESRISRLRKESEARYARKERNLRPLISEPSRYPGTGYDGEYAKAIRKLAKEYPWSSEGDGFWFDSIDDNRSRAKHLLRSSLQGLGLVLDASADSVSDVVPFVVEVQRWPQRDQAAA